jgi:DNA-binding PadR family transcriptional regulator
VYQVTNSQLYPALARFQEMGAVEREVVVQVGRPDKHLYRLTSVGSEVLHALLVDFTAETARRETEFYVRVAHFDLLTPAERMVILGRRRDVLSLRIERIASWPAERADGYVGELGRLRARTLELERGQIEAWLVRESQPAH